MFVSPPVSPPPTAADRPRRETVRLILGEAATERGRYLVSFLLILLANLIEIGWIRLMGIAVEEIAAGAGRALIAYELIGLAFFVFVVRWLYRTVTFFAGRRIERRLRTRLFGRLLALDESEMDRHRTGDLVSRIVNDVSDIRMVLGSGFIQIANNLVAYVTTLAAMMVFFPSLAIAALLPFLPLLVAARKVTAMTHERSFRAQEKLGALSAAVEETVAGIETIRSVQAETWQSRRFAAANERHFAAETDRIHPEALFGSMMGSVVWFGIALLILAAGLLGEFGRRPPGLADLATFIFLFVKLVWPTVALGWIINVIQRGLAAARRIMPFLEAEEKKEDGGGRRLEGGEKEGKGDALIADEHFLIPPPSALRPPPSSDVLLSRLAFRYPFGRGPLFADLDLAIRPGEWVGIVGPSASGKTTLARLIAGLRRPDSGELLVRGRPPSAIPAAERRRLVQLVPQNATLFSLTIAENLTLAGDDAAATLTDAIEAAAFDLAADVFPEGLETQVGERGLTLSGGQRQRLALARSLLADPAILILDDVISAVDVATEFRIMAGLERTRRRGDRTTLFITHRLRLLAAMDRVLVLEKGRVVADGPLDDVLPRSAWLRAGFEAEALRRADEAAAR